MITRYIEAAMGAARLERLEDGSLYADIPGFQGVYANAGSREDCLLELREVLEEWIVFRQQRGLECPSA